jgi:hypothetical protein
MRSTFKKGKQEKHALGCVIDEAHLIAQSWYITGYNDAI